MQTKSQAKYDHEVARQVEAAQSLSIQKQQRQNSEFNRQAYNVSVAQANQQRKDEHARMREANEMRIKHLEEIEQRMV